MSDLKTPWDGHWREGEYLGFVRWAIAQPQIRKQYRESTSDTFEPAGEPAAMEAQVIAGEAFAWLQRFSDWLAANVFGTPDDLRDELLYETERTMH